MLMPSRGSLNAVHPNRQVYHEARSKVRRELHPDLAAGNSEPVVHAHLGLAGAAAAHHGHEPHVLPCCPFFRFVDEDIPESRMREVYEGMLRGEAIDATRFVQQGVLLENPGAVKAELIRLPLIEVEGEKPVQDLSAYTESGALPGMESPTLEPD